MIKQSPVSYLLGILNKKWTVEILEALFDEELQFSELERRYPDMSGKMLSRRVKELFDLGLIGKMISSIQPLEFKYRLSDQARLLRPVFYQLAVVGAKLFRDEILEDPSQDTPRIEDYFKQLYLQS